MKYLNFSKRNRLLLAFIICLSIIRVITNIFPAFSGVANFSPMGALALFSGAFSRKRLAAFLFPIAGLWLSDLLIDRYLLGNWVGFYPGFYWVYGAFALMVTVGMIYRKRTSVTGIFLGTLFCTVIHWVVTDSGVFINGNLYPKNVSGWLACMAAAIPFEINFLAGTVLYAAILFVSAKWILNRNLSSGTNYTFHRTNPH